MHAVSRSVEPPYDDRGTASAAVGLGLGLERDALAGAANDPCDALTQTLFAANLVAGTLCADTTLPAAARELAETLLRLVRGALGESRLLAFDRHAERPAGTPDAAAAATTAELLRDAAAALAARGGFEIDVQAPPPGNGAEPPVALRRGLCQFAQAAIAHIAHMAPADRASLATRPALAADPVHLHWHVGVAEAGQVGTLAHAHAQAPANAGRLSVSGAAARPIIELELRWREQTTEASATPTSEGRA